MLLFNEVIDELKEFAVPDDTINRIILKLVTAGQQSVYASLGELHGVPAITKAQLGILVAQLIANQKEGEDGRVITG